MKYLYGASVQGIQQFIFQTNKLKEIVGASELVEQICTSKFRESINEIKEENIILNAAGNIRYVFDDKAQCEEFVKLFPKEVMEFAPGITISQAVIELKELLSIKDLEKLEEKLKTQRNKVAMPLETGFMGLERARRTGEVGFRKDKNETGNDDEVNSESTVKKLDAFDNAKKGGLYQKMLGTNEFGKEIPKEMSDITNQANSWIAIIHADGNGIGLLLDKLKTALSKSGADIQKGYSTFSKALDKATTTAAKLAFNKVVKDKLDANVKFYPFRPVVLGGDDITLIVRADFALDFTNEFLKYFEDETKTEFEFLNKEYKITGFEKGITACAGIVYMKEAYPFHYGIDLAEQLCVKAKKFSKSLDSETHKIPKSSIAFYKIQSSYVEDLEEMSKQTLYAEKSNMNFDFGPYLIRGEDNHPTVEQLQKKLDVLKEFSNDKTKSVSKLREWISELYVDKANADFMLDRMEEINPQFYKDLELEKEKEKASTIIYDLIQLHSLSS